MKERIIDYIERFLISLVFTLFVIWCCSGECPLMKISGVISCMIISGFLLVVDPIQEYFENKK